MESATKRGGVDRDNEGFGKLNELPEACVSHIISFTSPKDACRAEAVSVAFRAAASSDAVWDKFLPSDVDVVLDSAVKPVQYKTKKELYFCLCHPILVDNGQMTFSLDKLTGGKCYMLSARRLGITWGETPMYWRWIHLPESRFSEVAKLKSVCWLHINGTIESRRLSPKTTYEVFFVHKIEDNSYGLNGTQKTAVRIGAYYHEHSINLKPDVEGYNDDKEFRVCAERSDGWMEIEMGEFYNEDGDDNEVDVNLREIENGNWKKGLIVEGIEIRPKHVVSS